MERECDGVLLSSHQSPQLFGGCWLAMRDSPAVWQPQKKSSLSPTRSISHFIHASSP